MVPTVSRMLSGSVAIVVGFISAVAFTAVTDEPMALIGVPVAGAAGAWLGPRLDAGRRMPIKMTLLMAATCTVGGAYTVALAGGLDAPLLGTIGLMYLGIPVFLMLLVPAGAWAAVSAWLARSGWDSAR
jgi:hypothetical protein